MRIVLLAENRRHAPDTAPHPGEAAMRRVVFGLALDAVEDTLHSY
jgi:hypothetical protein